MERSVQKNGLINLLALLGVGLAGLVVARYANSLAGQVSVLFLGIGVLVAVVSWFQMRLEDRERLEKLELDELAKTHGGSALFEARDAEVFPAQRSREQFERFFVPGFTLLVLLLQAGGGVCSGAGCRKARPRPWLRRPLPGWRCSACSRWCFSCSAGFPLPSPGWSTTVCSGPGPATCFSMPSCA